jgi:hypothetical protein
MRQDILADAEVPGDISIFTQKSALLAKVLSGRRDDKDHLR